VGAAFGAFWWTSQRHVRRARRKPRELHDRGTVIFDNTPAASAVEDLI
jgi:hypothetical protein